MRTSFGLLWPRRGQESIHEFPKRPSKHKKSTTEETATLETPELKVNPFRKPRI